MNIGRIGQKRMVGPDWAYQSIILPDIKPVGWDRRKPYRACQRGYVKIWHRDRTTGEWVVVDRALNVGNAKARIARLMAQEREIGA